MKRRELVVAALLLTGLAGIAAAAEDSEHPSKNAQKLIATLDSVGINDKDVQDFIAEANTHIDNGYLNLTEDPMMGGTLALRYQLGAGLSPKQVELRFTPDDSHIAGTVRTNRVMVSYRIDF